VLGANTSVLVGASNDPVYGNDTFYFTGANATARAADGYEKFVFEQTTPGNIGNTVIVGFDPQKDHLTFSTSLTTAVSYHIDGFNNTIVNVDQAGDTVTLIGVAPADLQPHNFHFDPAAQIEHQLAQQLQQVHHHLI
jgi:hypothetical protein